MFILASQSPRRKELLKKLVDDFIVIPSDIDEHIDVLPYELPFEASYLKAKAIFNKHPDDIVLGCDTVVIIDGQLLGKPKDKNEAFMMLKKLSGRKHDVVSGYCLISKDKTVRGSCITEVYFNELSDDLINKYIATNSPMDKAGGYGIQDKEFNLVKKINGSLDNVIGLPVEEIKKNCF